MSAPASGREALLETIATQRLGCELAGSPLYADILDVVADDVRRSGPIDRLLEPVAAAPFGDAVLLRLLAGLHLLVLDGRAPALARHFPSVGGDPNRRRLARDVLDAVDQHAPELAERLATGVQTNEVGRSAALVGGYLEVARAGLPLRVLEVGASAGLNLAFDRYRYLGEHQAFGPTDSPLVFRRPWFAAEPDLSVPLEVASVRGSDIAPIDVSTPAGRLRLRSFVWPDQPDRLARLDAALAVVGDAPPPVDAAPAPAWLAEHLADEHVGVATVVAHSIMFQYLGPDARAEMVDRIEAAGQRATPTAPVAWLRLEPGGDQAELRLTTWPGGEARVLATSSYHGPPVVWRGGGA